MPRRIASLVPLVACWVSVAACSHSEPEPAPAERRREQSSENTAPTSIAITDAAGGEALTITVDHDTVDVRAGSRHVVGKTQGDKRYYHQGSLSGEAFVEVKISDAGFKVRTPDSKLLWKIKVADDKIKVSDNEENANAWALKTKYDDKVKVEDPSEREVGEVRFGAESGKIKIKDVADRELFVVRAGKRSAAYGVMLMSAVPEQYRDVIIAELIARGQ